MSDIEDLKRELLEVQSQLSFQEDTVANLNDALGNQQQELLVLRRQLEILKQRQDEQTTNSTDGGPSDEIPPHY